MRILLFLILFSLAASAQKPLPKISLSLTNASLEEAFKAIKTQSGYTFIYTREQLQQARPVNLQLRAVSLDLALEACFKDQPFTYVMDGRYIAVKEKMQTPAVLQNKIELSGFVRDENGDPVNGGSVTVKGTRIATATNRDGYFNLTNVNKNDVLVISSVGFQTLEFRLSGQSYIEVQLSTSVSELDEAVIIAYGTTTRRMNTGNVSKISSKEIERQPVSNFLGALQGRIPGLVITQSSGVPGSSFNVEIRGRSSLDLSLSRNDPFFIIDGVPFEPGNLPSNQLMSAANQPRNTTQGGLSPLNTISPSDIESIEVLKDADATAIYGSRGANGVILITTKKGKPGKTVVRTNIYSGWSKVSRTMDLLNTEQYVQMRREAIANDGATPHINAPSSVGYAPDLLIWDTTVYTDHRKDLIGNTATALDAQLSLSGGNAQTQFLVGSNFHKETNVFSRDLSDSRISFHFNFNHSPGKGNFSMQFSGLYSNENNELIQRDLTQFINLPPNLILYDSVGKPNWIQDGISIGSLGFSSPAAEFLKGYESINETLNSNLLLKYKILKNLSIHTSLGYNQFITDEISTNPKSSLNPATTQLAFSNFGNGRSRSWIIEPQLVYKFQKNRSRLDVLLGGTWQGKDFKSQTISASDYNSDLLLFSMGAAGRVTARNNASKYKYAALFTRITYNWTDRYILNLTGRRDGSSRFGPENRFSNFGAVGAAWIFSNESWIKNRMKFLSFGKLRGSYGITGNDQIGDYKFLDLWNSASITYQGNPSLLPNALFNPDYSWEKNKKNEVGLELGFLKERLFLSASLYKNRNSNQLINYKLSDQTGFSTVVRNFPAVVQNAGLEILLNTKNIMHKDFRWSTSLNITYPKNKLISFPELESSSYASSFVIGEPLNIIRGYNYLGVDPATGIYIVEDFNKDGMINSKDHQILGNSASKYFAGLQNTFSYKGFEFVIFFEGRKQIGKNYLAILANNQPGLPANQPTIVLDRWQLPGNNSSVQRFTSGYAGPAAYGAFFLSQSNGIYSDASFIRLKNVHLSYTISANWLRSIKVENASVYLQAQNLFIIANYLGSDPEIRDILTLPVLKTIALGIQVQF